MQTTVRKAIAAGLLSVLIVSGMSLASAGQAGAATAPTAPAPIEKFFHQGKLANADLTVQWRNLVNAVIKQNAPTLCTELSNLGSGFLKSTIKSICLSVGNAADPLAQLKKVLPTVCAIAPYVFPSYKTYIVAACALLV